MSLSRQVFRASLKYCFNKYIYLVTIEGWHEKYSDACLIVNVACGQALLVFAACDKRFRWVIDSRIDISLVECRTSALEVDCTLCLLVAGVRHTVFLLSRIFFSFWAVY